MASRTTRDVPCPPRRSGGPAQRGGTLIGMFIGLILGLALAAGVAYWLSKGGALGPRPPTPQPGSKEAAKTATRPEGQSDRFDFYRILPGGEEPRIKPPETRPVDAPPDRAKGRADAAKVEVVPSDAPRTEAARPDAPRADAAKTDAKGDQARPEAAKGEARKGERYFLQAGAFRSQDDAENQKARLALAGWEAMIQPTTTADRSTVYRVRVGPFDSSDEMNRSRTELAKRGFDVSVIRNP